MEPGTVEESIKQSINREGFPDKVVRLPFKPIYDCCKKNGVALNNVLSNLKAKNIIGKIQGNYIVFHSSKKVLFRKEEIHSSQEDAWSLYNLKEFANFENIKEMALDQLAKLPPEQLAKIHKMAENLDPNQKTRILELFTQINKPKP